MKYDTNEKVLKALSQVDEIITERLGIDQYDTPMECAEDHGGLPVELEDALELAAKHGFYDECDEDTPDEVLNEIEPVAIQFVRQLLKKQIPEDFPYAIVHENIFERPLFEPIDNKYTDKNAESLKFIMETRAQIMPGQEDRTFIATVEKSK